MYNDFREWLKQPGIALPNVTTVGLLYIIETIFVCHTLYRLVSLDGNTQILTTKIH